VLLAPRLFVRRISLLVDIEKLRAAKASLLCLALALVAVHLLVLNNASQAQTWGDFEVVHQFGYNPSTEKCITGDGATPYGTLIGSEGVLYGTTTQGGFGSGTVFSVNASATNGSDTVLYKFGSQPNDGKTPFGRVQLDSGFLYGTTSVGGGNSGGTVFQVSATAGGETVLNRFAGADGSQPHAGLTSGTLKGAKVFFGTTAGGGNSSTTGGHGGVVFAVNTAGVVSSLYAFCSDKSSGGICLDGYLPHAGVVQSSGNLYGTTLYGGTYNLGTVFKVNLKTGVETVLHSFGGPQVGGQQDGQLPQGGVVFAKGYLYGTTYYGGNNGKGTVFAVSASDGDETVLWSFLGNFYNDGQSPMSELLAAPITGGTALYGTTSTGGNALGNGTIFMLPVNGASRLSNPITFWQIPSGQGTNPLGGLIKLGGKLYGTMSTGGKCTGQGGGVVFRIAPPS